MIPIRVPVTTSTGPGRARSSNGGASTDSVAPAKATLRHARKAPRGEIKLYPEGHFDIYLGEPFERVVADQIRFLTNHVPPANAHSNSNSASTTR